MYIFVSHFQLFDPVFTLSLTMPIRKPRAILLSSRNFSQSYAILYGDFPFSISDFLLLKKQLNFWTRDPANHGLHTIIRNCENMFLNFFWPTYFGLSVSLSLSLSLSPFPSLYIILG